ncbi:acetolactate synthase [Bradyrhizobium sp. NAS80.1]|uniref:thiamine pyrophosphate-dependent enzyme n=1 Tax=Bradyrhizobium sp. NAS80.1 TaxID=1680159 RepID=UPI000960D7AE|nr:thiamine pyrophosphate-dependent enzyme [Bradyrhizobium sp. NAS80.1]OKO88271.1 acetolactate synthase [Bradyrhizobium sp. NAS80.1]
MMRSANLLVDALKAHGVDRIFCVPGESYLSVLDALMDETAVDVVTTRHESGAGFMALADARLTGRPGVAFVSRGPGAMNAAIAIHSAQQDAVPFVLFVGQVERHHRHMNAFQEVDYNLVFSSMAKWVVEVSDANRLPDMVATAFHAALSGTPGPVVVVLPEDMLEDEVTPGPIPVYSVARSASAVQDVEAVANMIASARRPLLIAGGLLKSPQGQQALRATAEAFSLPVAMSVRHADLLDNDHPLYAGHLAYGAPAELAAAVAKADLVIGIGARLGDVTSQGYSFPAAPKPAQPVVQVWPDAMAVGSVRSVERGISADPVLFLEQMRARAPAEAARDHRVWSAELHAIADGLRGWNGPAEAEDGVIFGAFVKVMDRALGREAIVTLDAGNFGGWVQRLMRFGGGRMMLAPSSGAMGFGVPGAIAASLRQRDKRVVCFVGDGGFLMTGNELATAIQYGAKPIVVISDNGSYGTIRMHQEKNFPGRVGMTALVNPDFAALATTYGALGLRVDEPKDIEPVVQEALGADRASIICVRTSLEHISVAATIETLRQRSAA